MRRTRAGGTSASHGTVSTASFTMMPVVCSLAPALDFFSSTMTLSPASAAARAQASPAKLAPTTSRSTTVFEIRSLAAGGARQAAKKGGASKREKELEADMG